MHAPQSHTFFTQQPDATKQNTRGYSGFGIELVRGETPMPKESIYFFRRNDMQQQGVVQQHQRPAPQDFHRSVTLLYKVRHANTTHTPSPPSTSLAD